MESELLTADASASGGVADMPLNYALPRTAVVKKRKVRKAFQADIVSEFSPVTDGNSGQGGQGVTLLFFTEPCTFEQFHPKLDTGVGNEMFSKKTCSIGLSGRPTKWKTS